MWPHLLLELVEAATGVGALEVGGARLGRVVDRRREAVPMPVEGDRPERP
jgi:hypothetical protein